MEIGIRPNKFILWPWEMWYASKLLMVDILSSALGWRIRIG